MLAVNTQRLIVTTFGELMIPYMPLNVRHMPNCMSQFERISLIPVKSHSFLVVPKSGVVVMHVSLNLAKIGQSPRQLTRHVSFPAKHNGLHQIALRIVKSILSSRLKSLTHQLIDFVNHGCVLLSHSECPLNLPRNPR